MTIESAFSSCATGPRSYRNLRILFVSLSLFPLSLSLLSRPTTTFVLSLFLYLLAALLFFRVLYSYLSISGTSRDNAHTASFFLRIHLSIGIIELRNDKRISLVFVITNSRESHHYSNLIECFTKKIILRIFL